MMSPALISDMLLPVWVSIKLAGVTTLCLLVFATPLAYWLAKPSRGQIIGRIKIMLMGVIAMPLVLPPTVIGFYLLLLLSPNFGIGKWLLQYNISAFVFTFEGLVIGSIIYSLPFFVQPVYAQFLRIPTSVMEVASLLEPSRFRRFIRVALPQARIGIILGSLISFAHTIGEFGVVLMIGGSISGETKVVSIAIYEQVEALNYEAAHMMSAILIIMGMVMVALIASVSRLYQRP
ncbi:MULTISPECIES: molybdate ABC transporter permease subunit [Psychrobacter]|uniref:Molybdenum transport system permease n=1 Tax=Psychrobacter cryohalolentis (strain ATCC BAA-1226 / DSM 17306 / VKM B-2378 / K5) TaxID=335284 RepID=Q1QCW5_PSYCK|nr:MULTISPECIES: molybdate ABC transporter permease subunit [Psychrobacter]ABE74488.1 Molybdate ABC transporter, permease protein [Psychrobacter cryohalolentis K5]AGP48341.1 molybdenum ABC transporter permease [Psychrobacter sp. G]ASE27111.1 molybdate ABC transporter permease subunit [Psychrobacter cryohalolentis]KAA0930800.1 molybdate ABC transporter permease subunit [Psychrobacter sp. ANT_H59]